MILYSPTLLLIKESILLQYLRVFVPYRKDNSLLYWTIMALMWIVFMFYSSLFLVSIFGCWPRSKISNPLVPGKCVDANMVYLVGGCFNMITDILILCVPISPVWRLQLQRKRKVLLIAVFGTGLM